MLLNLVLVAPNARASAGMPRPIRLVPQPAQAVEFSCPLCKSVHAPYVFGTRHFRIHRCAGCSLTFGNPRPNDEPPAVASTPGADREIDRDEAQHASLLDALKAQSLAGRVLLVADPDEDLAALLTRQ